MMKLKLGLNLNTILFILLAIVFSIIIWLVIKKTRIIEGATTRELNNAKTALDNANTRLRTLNTELTNIESANKSAINKYKTDIAFAISKVVSQTAIVNTLQPKFNAQSRIVYSTGISPNLYDMNQKLQAAKTLLETYRTNRENIRKAHAKAVDTYNRTKKAKNKQITEQTRVVRNAQNTYNKFLPPIINSITAGDGKVTLSISPVAGTNPIGYVINSGGIEQFTNEVNRPYVFDGLTNGTSYTFRVASNYGSSTSTDAISNSITPRTTIEIRKLTPDNGQVTIDIANNDGVVPFTYTVVSNPSTTSLSTTNVNAPIVFKGLKNRIVYTFTVVATYRDGRKSNAIKSLPVIPLSTISASVQRIEKNNVNILIANNNAGNNHSEVIYTITTSPDNIIKTSRSFSNDISGLKPNTTYAFNIKATYLDGTPVGSVQNISIQAKTAK